MSKKRQPYNPSRKRHPWCKEQHQSGDCARCAVLFRDYPFKRGETEAEAAERYFPRVAAEAPSVEREPQLVMVQPGNLEMPAQVDEPPAFIDTLTPPRAPYSWQTYTVPLHRVSDETREDRMADEAERILTAKTPRRTQKPYKPNESKGTRSLSEEDLESMIHAGPVSAQLRQHADIVTEVVDKTGDGWPLAVRQMIATPVRRLLEQEAVDIAGVFGATMLRYDHDIALYNRMSGKWEMRVDGGRAGVTDMEKRLFHAGRMRDAFEHLGHELGQIAWLSIIERPLGDLKATHTSVGQSLLPKGTNVEQRGAGKGTLVIVVRELARYYKLVKAPDLPHIQQLSYLDWALNQKKSRNIEKSA